MLGPPARENFAMRMDAPGRGHGFTLVELMVTLAVVAILAGIAVPTMQELAERQRVAAAMHGMTTELAMARTAAISSRTPVTLCPSRGDGLCSGGTDWSRGWLLYRDPARQGQPRSPDDVLRDETAPVHSSIRILSSSGRVRVRYRPDGLSPGTNLTLRVCAGERLHAEIIVNNAGRARWRKAAPGRPCEARA